MGVWGGAGRLFLCLLNMEKPMDQTSLGEKANHWFGYILPLKDSVISGVKKEEKPPLCSMFNVPPELALESNHPTTCPKLVTQLPWWGLHSAWPALSDLLPCFYLSPFFSFLSTISYQLPPSPCLDKFCEGMGYSLHTHLVLSCFCLLHPFSHGSSPLLEVFGHMVGFWDFPFLFFSFLFSSLGFFYLSNPLEIESIIIILSPTSYVN